MESFGGRGVLKRINPSGWIIGGFGHSNRIGKVQKNSTKQKVKTLLPCWHIHTKVIICCCSVTKSCPTLWDPIDGSTPGFPVLHCLPEFAQTHVHWVGDAMQPSHPLLSPFLPAFNLSQHQVFSTEKTESLFQLFASGGQVMELPYDN